MFTNEAADTNKTIYNFKQGFGWTKNPTFLVRASKKFFDFDKYQGVIVLVLKTLSDFGISSKDEIP